MDCESEDFAKVEIPLDEFFGAFEKQPHEHTKVLKIKVSPASDLGYFIESFPGLAVD